MSSEQTVWNMLKGHNPYNVMCRHNVWTGSRYEASAWPIRVLATTPEEAKQFIIGNLDLAEKHLRGIRVRRGVKSIRAIRLSERYHLKPNDILRATPIKGTMSIEAFNQQGELVRYDK